jgi:hypothetical protein
LPGRVFGIDLAQSVEKPLGEERQSSRHDDGDNKENANLGGRQGKFALIDSGDHAHGGNSHDTRDRSASRYVSQASGRSSSVELRFRVAPEAANHTTFIRAGAQYRARSAPSPARDGRAGPFAP